MLGGRRAALLVALTATAVLLAAACGSGDDDGAAPKATPSSGKVSTSAATAATPAIASDALPKGAQRLHLEDGPITVQPGQNNIAYSRGAIEQPKEDGWIVGITPN